MSSTNAFLVASALLVGLGLYTLLAHPDLLRRIVAANVLGAGVFLLLVTFAQRGDGTPDPVPHALVLTGIVVAVSFTGLAVALIAWIDDDERDEERD
jgi:multicomponent Na+:H+ antiporter subunit C